MADETGSARQGSGPIPGGPAESGQSGGFVALRSGLTIRHYIVEEVIGAGGFGITYRARHDRLKSKVFALKEFFPRQFAARRGTHVISTPDGGGLFRWGLDRFLKEAEALAKCEHPGIVDVVDYFEENGTAYAVLGYVEGQQLGQWLDSLGRPPTQAELDRILMPLLDALEVVHGAKLLHRDIAPDNILIRRDGSPCLIDFGACREDIRERSQKISAIVKHGYSPPEQYHGIAELQGPWTDIYAVGATLYRAISGQPPMDSSRRGALGDALKPVSEMTENDYRPGFTAAIDMALRLKPDERPQSISDWRAMLTDAAPAAGSERPQSFVNPAQARHAATAARDATSAANPPRRSTGAASVPADTAALRAPSTGQATSSRRGPLVAGIAVLALASAGAFAYWRSAPTIPPSASASSSQTAPAGRAEPGVAATSVPAKTTVSTPLAPVAPIAPSLPIPDPEQRADAAWRSLAGSTDAGAIERFLSEHGTTRVAAAARARLATLRDEQARTEATAAAAARAKEIADETARQRTRDANWSACQSATDTEKAARCTTVANSDDTPDRRAEALHQLGLADRRLGNYDKAIAELTRALDLAPAAAQVLTDRGIAHFLKGDPAGRDAAMRDYDDAIRANPNHAESLNNRAWSLLQAGRASDALADANRSIEANPANGYAYDTRGQILEALGRREDAIRDYERAIAIDATQETSRAALARLRPRAR